jgi:hypothetical protein
MAVVTVTNVEKTPETGAISTSQISANRAADSASTTVVVWSMASVVVVTAVMCVMYRYVIHPKPITLVKSYVPYAGVIAVSAGLERLLQPLSEKFMQNPPSPSGSASPAQVTPGAQQGDPVAQGGPGAQGDPAPAAAAPAGPQPTMKKIAADSMTEAKRAAADPAVGAGQVQKLVDIAASAQAQVETLRTNRAVFFWAIASVCGLVISGAFGIFLLQSIASGPVNPYLDLAVTGLFIGAGTKPTHDLISSLQAKSGSSS